MEGLKDSTKTGASNLSAMALRAADLATSLIGLKDSLHGPDFRGDPAQLKALEEAQKKLEEKQKAVHPHESEQDKAAREKKEAQERLELEKKIREEKEKLSEEISRQREQNELQMMSDAQKLKYYEDQLKLAEAQVAAKKEDADYTVEDLKALQSKLVLESKVADLRKKVNDEQFKEWKEKNKKEAGVQGGGATFDGVNHAFANFNDLKGVNLQMLEKLTRIDQRLGYIQANNQSSIFTK
jgi:DNA repair exonuclease SbcCD ATPase subunit